MKRTDVYQLIDTERDYQEVQAQNHNWGQGTGVPRHSHGGPGSSPGTGEANNHEVGTFLALMETYVRRGLDAHEDATGYRGPVNDNEALNNVRKIAALAVACMERHGAPSR